MATKKRLPDRLSREHSFKLNYVNVRIVNPVKTYYYTAYSNHIQYANCKLILEDDYYRPEIHMHIRFNCPPTFKSTVDVDLYIPWWEAKKLAEILNKLAEAGKYHDPAER